MTSKSSAQIADGFPRQDRLRAHTLRKHAYREGVQAAVLIIDGMLATPGLTDEELVHAMSIWVKEMKEQGDPG